jgi:hypothetical protein
MVGHIEMVERERVAEIGGMEDSSYRIRLDTAEFTGWVALPTPDHLWVQGYFIAAHVDGAHSWAPPTWADWQNLNTFSGWVLFFKPGELESAEPIINYRDDSHNYKARLSNLPDYRFQIDLDSWATLAVCLGYQGNPNALNLPWIWNRSWFNISSEPYGRP